MNPACITTCLPRRRAAAATSSSPRPSTTTCRHARRSVVDHDKLAGVGFLPESKRIYPSNLLAAPVLGTVGTEQTGLSGLESQYNSLLEGHAGTITVEVDQSGHEIPRTVRKSVPAERGSDLVLSIDENLQYQVESSLADQVAAQHATGGTAVVTDVRTGDILAMASVDGMAYGSRLAGPLEHNRPMTDVLEPGSTNKAITVATALQDHLITPNTSFTVPDQIEMGGHEYKDDEIHPTEQMNAGQILTQSSNVGAIGIASLLGKERLDHALRSFGLGSLTAAKFPGQSPGLLIPVSQYADTGMGSVPIGYGLAVTPLQMVDVYATLANGGVTVPPRLLDATISPNGKRKEAPVVAGHRVVSATTASQVTQMLEGVVRQGTGVCAAVPGFDVAGKTGTSRIPLASGGYSSSQHMASFVGYAPAEAPRIASIVILNNPRDVYGGSAAAPVFSEIMAAALRPSTWSRRRLRRTRRSGSSRPRPRCTRARRAASRTARSSPRSSAPSGRRWPPRRRRPRMPPSRRHTTWPIRRRRPARSRRRRPRAARPRAQERRRGPVQCPRRPQLRTVRRTRALARPPRRLRRGRAPGRSETSRFVPLGTTAVRSTRAPCSVASRARRSTATTTPVAAERAGASAFLVERFVDVEGPQVRVASVRAAVGPIAARLLGDPSKAMTVLGVTGTNGKTTTCYLLEAIAVAAGRSFGVIGTVETRYAQRTEGLRHTTPEATELQALLARMRDAGVETVAMEVSSHALDQHRVDGTRFAVVCFTNLSQDHLDYHGTFDAYVAAKRRLFTPEFTDRAAVNVTTPIGRTIADDATAGGLRVVTFAIEEPAAADRNVRAADLHAGAVELGPRGTRFQLHDRRTGRELERRALAARPVQRRERAGGRRDRAHGRRRPRHRRRRALGSAGRSRPHGAGRQRSRARGARRLRPHSRGARAGARSRRAIAAPEGRVIVVFGCGGDRDREKRPKMGAARARPTSRCSPPTTRAPKMRRRSRPRSSPAFPIAAPSCSSTAAPRSATRSRSRAGDVVLIAGKGHEQGQISAGVTVPFDDRTVAREELEALRCA